MALGIHNKKILGVFNGTVSLISNMNKSFLFQKWKNSNSIKLVVFSEEKSC